VQRDVQRIRENNKISETINERISRRSIPIMRSRIVAMVALGLISVVDGVDGLVLTNKDDMVDDNTNGGGIGKLPSRDR
jgi:hypothetical protein